MIVVGCVHCLIARANETLFKTVWCDQLRHSCRVGKNSTLRKPLIFKAAKSAPRFYRQILPSALGKFFLVGKLAANPSPEVALR